MRAYCRYIFYLGAEAMPEALILVADILSRGQTRQMLTNDVTLFYIETLVSPYVYGEPMRLKANPALRDAVLKLLDELVEAGSSAAFRLRDDFVTPTLPAV